MDIINGFLGLVNKETISAMANVIFLVTCSCIILTEIWLVLALGHIDQFINKLIGKPLPKEVTPSIGAKTDGKVSKVSLWGKLVGSMVKDSK